MPSGLRILLVEDNPGDARLIQEVLADSGNEDYVLKHVDSLTKMREQLMDDYIDAILLDLSLPDSQGLETLKKVRGWAPDLPVIVLTGLDDEAVAIQAVKSGAQDYLVKGQIGLMLLKRSIHYAIERQRLFLRQQQMERLAGIGRTITRVSHHIKNIINRMAGSMRLIDEGNYKKGDPEFEEMWSVFKRSVINLSEFSEEMLDFAKERLPTMNEENLNELATHVYRICRPDALENNVELELQLDPELPSSVFSYTEISEAFTNLLDNAIDACAQNGGGKVVIQTAKYPEDNCVCISVSDNGPGIPENIQDKIFEPFFSTKEESGTGLGLAIARKAILKHNGGLDMSSRNGETRFCISLPIRLTL